MAELFYTILTTLGLTKLAAAQAGGTTVNLTTIKAGDSGGAYREVADTDVDVTGEVWSGAINQIAVDSGNANWLVIETAIPTDVGDFTIREVGVFDDAGDLIAIGKYPETYKPAIAQGAGKDLYIRMIIELANADLVTLQIDPAVVMASRKYADDELDTLRAELASPTVTEGSDMMAHAGTGNTVTQTLDDHEGRLNTHEALDTHLPVGAIIEWNTGTPPAGTLECDGSPISRATYSALFAVLGTIYGVGDGATTFNIPDRRGYAPRGWDHGAGVDPDAGTRTDRGDGTVGDNVGTKQTDEFKSHNHTNGAFTNLVGTDAIAGVIENGAPPPNGRGEGALLAAGGNETRMKNINVMYVIKY